MIQAVLFDMDGVLIDACEIHRRAFRLACHAVGVDIPREGDLEGLPTRVKLGMLGVSPAQAETIYELKQLQTANAAQAYPPDRQKMDLLAWLKEEGYLVGVYSNAIQSTVESFLISAGLISSVDAYASADLARRPKPAPDGYLDLMRHLNVEPNECLIVEDSDVGYQAAVRSGARVLRVEGPEEVTKEAICQALWGSLVETEG